MKVRFKWPNAACYLHLKVGVERPKFSPHDFAGELTQTTTDHSPPDPFFPPTQKQKREKAVWQRETIIFTRRVMNHYTRANMEAVVSSPIIIRNFL